MSRNLISGEFGARGQVAPYPSPQHGSRERPAPTGQIRLVVTEIVQQANEGAPGESVARRIERQVIVAAGNLASFKETLRKRFQYIDSSSHPIKHILPLLVMKAQASPQAPIDRVT